MTLSELKERVDAATGVAVGAAYYAWCAVAWVAVCKTPLRLGSRVGWWLLPFAGLFAHSQAADFIPNQTQREGE